MADVHRTKKRSQSSRSKRQTQALLESFATLTQTEPASTTVPECLYRAAGEREQCDLCSYAVAFTDEGFLACTNDKCGTVYRDVVDHSAEWRNYGEGGSDPTRCGMPVNPLLQQSSYGCRVICPSNASYEMRRIRRYTDWQSMPYREKSQYDEFSRIHTLANQSGIPKMIIDDALRHHKRVSEHQTFRGLNRDGIIAASIYVACRTNGFPRTAREIATMFKLDSASATKGCKNAVAIINELEEDTPETDRTNFAETTAVAFIERFCSKLSLNAEMTKLCQFVTLKLEKNNWIPENTPHAKAAGVVYFVAQTCGVPITKQDVHRVSDISEVTVNKCYKKLALKVDQLIPSQFLRTGV